MNLIEASLLGLVQGLTEFLPISSSGHLILARALMGLHQEDQLAFIFDVLVQMGTWLAVVIYFWRDLVAIAGDMLRRLRGQPAPQARLGWLIILATIPAVLAGWWMKDSVAGVFSGLAPTGWFLIANALLLSIAELFGRRTRSLESANTTDALTIGAFQVLALLPAVSRSASTLAGGMVRNFTRSQAARFAFLMAVPIMPAAAVVALIDLGGVPQADGLLLPLLFGFAFSALFGYLTIRWLLNYLSHRPLYPFVIYCLVVGVATLLLI